MQNASSMFRLQIHSFEAFFYFFVIHLSVLSFCFKIIATSAVWLFGFLSFLAP